VNLIVDALRDQGINIIPVHPKSKQPSVEWTKYQNEKYTEPIPPGFNYAVIGGDISNNLLIIDIDHVDDESLIEKIIPNALNETLVVRTGGGGYHIYLFLESGGCKSFKFDNAGVHYDIQCEGKIAVGPGSIHESGNEYKIISNTKFIKTITNAKLKENLSILYDTRTIGLEEGLKDYDTIGQGNVTKGNRHNEGLSYANHLMAINGTWTEHTLLAAMNDWNSKLPESIPDSEVVQICKDVTKFQGSKGQVEDKEQGSIENVVTDIMTEFYFRTIKETDELLYYKDGVFVNYGEKFIEALAEQKLKKPRTASVREVVNMIRRQTYTSREQFDSDPNILNVKNGLLDIKTLEFRDHDPKYPSRIQLPVDYDRDAVSSKFNQYLEEWLPDEDARHTALEAAASCLLRTSKFEKAIMFIGEGANGKSTFLSIIENMLGEDNISNVSIHDLVARPFSRAELDAKLANIYADIDSSEIKQPAILKMLVTGENMTAEKKNKNPFRMKSFAKLIFSANKFPKIDDQSKAFFRRFIIIEWLESFENKADTRLVEKLSTAEELSGLFNTLTKVACDMNERGSFLHTPDIDKLNKKWNEFSKPIDMFLNSETEKQAKRSTGKMEMYTEYIRFCSLKRIAKVSNRVFNNSMEEAGYIIVQRDNNRVWDGVVLKSKVNQTDSEKLG
jgi:putative DNA primase/helicase